VSQPYLDTSAVVKLIVAEPDSKRVLGFLGARKVSVPFTRLVEMETVNTLHAKFFREEMTRPQLSACNKLIADYLAEGRFFRPVLSLDEVASESLRLIPSITKSTGCRTLDLMHVASAKLLGFLEFASTDQRQLLAAEAARLKPVNLLTYVAA